MLSRFFQGSISWIPWRVRKVVKDLPLVAPLQRWVVHRFLSGSSFVHTINAGPARGLRYPVELPKDKLIWTGTYEVALAEAISSAIGPGSVCYDVGGYRGFFSGVMACRGAAAVHTFEPLPENSAQIKAMQRENPLLPIRLHEFALGSEPGEVEFVLMPEASMGKLQSSTFESGDLAAGRMVVKVDTIDALVTAGVLPPADVIKIDVEGAEAMVLRGSSRLLDRYRPALFIEAHSRQLTGECCSLLEAVGYEVVALETGRHPDYFSEPEVCHLIARGCGNAG